MSVVECHLKAGPRRENRQRIDVSAGTFRKTSRWWHARTANDGFICLVPGESNTGCGPRTSAEDMRLVVSHLESKHLPATYYCTVCILDLTGNADRIENVEMFLPGIALLRRALWIGFTEKAVPDEIKFAKRLGTSSVISSRGLVLISVYFTYAGCGPQVIKLSRRNSDIVMILSYFLLIPGRKEGGRKDDKSWVPRSHPFRTQGQGKARQACRCHHELQVLLPTLRSRPWT